MNNQKRNLTRKEFLLKSVFGMGALGSGILFPHSVTGSAINSLEGIGVKPKKVLIIGAGLSGLSAAWELKDAGHEVSVMEARNRPGGRVSTVMDPFDSDIYVEEGAVAFSNAYTVARKYINKFELPSFPLSLPEKPVYYMKGKRFMVSGGEIVKWPYDLTPEEQMPGPMGLVKKYIIDPLPPEISDPKNWDETPLVSLDKMSLGEYMRSHGASEAAVNLVKNTQYFGVIPYQTSALSVAVSDFGLFMGGAPFILPGGNDQFPRSMAEPIKDIIHYGVEVKAINDNENGVVINAIKNGNNVEFKADRVICTLPATVLKDLKINPLLPYDQREAIDGLQYLNYTRTYLQFDRAYWQDEGLSGAGFTDLDVGQVNGYPGSDPSNIAVLESFIAGPNSYPFAELSRADLISKVKKGINKVFPGVDNHYQNKAHVKAWINDPYARGATSFPAPGQVTSYLKILQKSHGNIHFAGEHTTILRSTMEGGLRSGIRAAKEVHAAV